MGFFSFKQKAIITLNCEYEFNNLISCKIVLIPIYFCNIPLYNWAGLNYDEYQVIKNCVVEL